MTHQLKTFDDKVLVMLRIVDKGTEFFISSEYPTLKQKITQANKEHGLQFEKDLLLLNGIDTNNVEEKFKEVSENWGLKYEINN